MPTYPFWNRPVDKGTMKRLIAWFLVHVGPSKTVQMIEELKQVGFHHATRAGISLSIDDLRVPPTKSRLIRDANIEINSTQARYEQGYVTVVERFQRVIDTWNGTSETLKEDVVQHFLATDPLNPVYMMAFSGARGNLSQVRQLVGMRGLMADSAGEIIDLPVKSNFREGLTVTEYIISCYGARKGLVDTALRTANSGYLTRRLVDVAQDVIVRTSDCNTTEGLFVSALHAKFSSKVMETVEERIVGRVLYHEFLSPTGETLYPKGYCVSQPVASELHRLGAKSVPVRSVLTCQLRRGVCRLCYGWNLSNGKIVSVGEAVGILAAQSIGEPGTQLTMRTFHTGGVFSGGTMEEVRAPRTGVVRYTQPVDHQRIRTRHGDDGILTIGATKLIIDGASGSTTIDIPKDMIVVAEAGEVVRKNQLIAEVASYSLINAIRTRKAIKSEIDGEVIFDQMSLKIWPSQVKRRAQEAHLEVTQESQQELKPDKKSSKVVRKPQKQTLFSPIVRNDGYVWVLEGHVRTLEMPTKFFASAGDLVEAQSVLTSSTRISPVEGTLQGWARKGRPHAVVSRGFGSLGFEGVEAWLPCRASSVQLSQGPATPLADGLSLTPDLYHSSTPGIIRYDWVDGAPTRCWLVPEEVRTLSPQQGWIIAALSGQSVGPGTMLATRDHHQWHLTEGRLSMKSEKYYATSQAWIQVVAPSLKQMESGHADCQVLVKPGWAAEVPHDLEVPEGTLAAGAPIMASWVFPSSRVLIERAGQSSAVLVRPVHSYPIYPSEHWHECMLTKTWPDQHTSANVWHPRPIGPGRHLPSRMGDVTVVQEFPYQDGDRLPPGGGMIRIRMEWPRSGTGWQLSSYLSPPHRGLSGRLDLVGTARLWTSVTNAPAVTKMHADRVIALQGHGIHRLTPLGQRMVLSQHEGEVVRVVRDQALQTDGLFTLEKGTLREEDVERDVFLGKDMAKQAVLLAPKHLVTISTGDERVTIRPQRTIQQGHRVAPGVSTPVSGLVVEVRSNRLTIRLGNPYRVSHKARVAVWPSEVVRAGQTLAHLIYRRTKTGDIVQGLPKVEEILEARRKKGARRIPCNPYDHIQKLYKQYLQEESKPRAIYHCILSMQLRLLRRVQHVYRAQGVQISDKHIEIIVRRMTSRVLIERGRGTGLLPGELVERRRVDRINQAKERVVYLPVVLGITKAALTTSSFISAASFQETTRVLSEAAVCGKIDWLEGLKENVILGRLIPAGVGFYGHKYVPHEMATRRVLLMIAGAPPPTPPRELRGIFHTVDHYWNDLEEILRRPPKSMEVKPEEIVDASEENLSSSDQVPVNFPEQSTSPDFPES